jgi:hypothetical protein
MTDKTITSSIPASAVRDVAHANGTEHTLVCFNPNCRGVGTHFPVILFGPIGRIPGQALPYRLEIPQAACPNCQRSFQPEVFVSDAARGKIEHHLRKHDRPMPDYERLFVIWKSLFGPDWAEVKDAGEARFCF